MVRLALVPGIRLMDWVLLEGIVVDEKAATDGSPCTCLEPFCFHRGVLGPVSMHNEEAMAEFCSKREEFDSPVRERVELFRDAFRDCPRPPVPPEATALEANLTVLEELLKCGCSNLKTAGLDVCGVGAE